MKISSRKSKAVPTVEPTPKAVWPFEYATSSPPQHGSVVPVADGTLRKAGCVDVNHIDFEVGFTQEQAAAFLERTTADYRYELNKVLTLDVLPNVVADDWAAELNKANHITNSKGEIMKIHSRKSKEVDCELLRSTDNAAVWAAEFAKVHPEIDQGTMIGWFANCAEGAKDLLRWRQEPQQLVKDEVVLQPCRDPLSELRAASQRLDEQSKTRSQLLREAGYTRRPSFRSLPSDE